MDKDIRNIRNSEVAVKPGLEEDNDEFSFCQVVAELLGGHPGPAVSGRVHSL